MNNKAFNSRPAGIEYGLEDRPPRWQFVLLVIQYVFIVYGSLMIPALIVQESGSNATEAQQLISSSLMVMGICTMLQSSRRFGAGYLCPAVCGAEFAPASIAAVQHGGYSLLAGMLMATGAFQAAISPLVAKLRPFFPVEVTGVVVFMTGLSLVKYCFTSFLGIVNGQLFVDHSAMVLAFVSLAIMVIPCVWGRGIIRQNAGLLGLLGGTAIALMGNFPVGPQGSSGDIGYFVALPFMAWHGWSWSMEMIAPFFIAGLCALLGTLGNITACQKNNTVNWHRPDMRILSKGVFVEALGNITGGVLGGAGQGSSAVSVGMSIATGVTSRRIGFGVGACCVILSFFPGVAALYAFLPRPVLDASLLLGVSFMLLAGIQIITSRMIDIRRTLIIGISIVAGLCVDMVPGMQDALIGPLRPVFASPLSLAAIVAVSLNLLFRIGIRESAQTQLSYNEDIHDQVHNFLEERGAAWSMRKEVVERAKQALVHYIEGVTEINSAPTVFKVKASFDEYLFVIEIVHQGKSPDLSGSPLRVANLLDDDSGLEQLEGYLVRHYTDRVSKLQHEDRVDIKLEFDH